MYPVTFLLIFFLYFRESYFPCEVDRMFGCTWVHEIENGIYAWYENHFNFSDLDSMSYFHIGMR